VDRHGQRHLLGKITSWETSATANAALALAALGAFDGQRKRTPGVASMLFSMRALAHRLRPQRAET
jgi:hypothetical protein